MKSEIAMRLILASFLASCTAISCQQAAKPKFQSPAKYLVQLSPRNQKAGANLAVGSLLPELTLVSKASMSPTYQELFFEKCTPETTKFVFDIRQPDGEIIKSIGHLNLQDEWQNWGGSMSSRSARAYLAKGKRTNEFGLPIIRKDDTDFTVLGWISKEFVITLLVSRDPDAAKSVIFCHIGSKKLLQRFAYRDRLLSCRIRKRSRTFLKRIGAE